MASNNNSMTPADGGAAERIAILEAALEPFAAYADPNGKVPAIMPITQGSSMARKQLTMGDCYVARVALAGRGPK